MRVSEKKKCFHIQLNQQFNDIIWHIYHRLRERMASKRALFIIVYIEIFFYRPLVARLVCDFSCTGRTSWRRATRNVVDSDAKQKRSHPHEKCACMLYVKHENHIQNAINCLLAFLFSFFFRLLILFLRVLYFMLGESGGRTTTVAAAVMRIYF